MIRRMLICGCMLFAMNVAGQETASKDSGDPQRSKMDLVKKKLHQVQAYLDSSAMRKVDARYIEVPKKPWRVDLRYKSTAFDVDYHNSIADPTSSERFDWKMCFEPPLSGSIGVWVGYRGTGLAIAKSLKKKSGIMFSFSTTGAKYGANLRLRSFKNYESKLSATIHMEDEDEQFGGIAYTDPPVEISSLYLNGYWVFNGRRYSQAAAYNQSVIQRRSAGSLLTGATLYMSSFDFSDHVSMVVLSNNMNRIRLHQLNVGVGYGYNWVPLRGLVVNAMAMPTLSIYNQVKVFKYNSNILVASSEEGQKREDYGEWNKDTHTWANGEKQMPIELIIDDDDWEQQVDLWDAPAESENNAFRFNVDLRVGIAYNWKDYYVGAQMQLNSFSYKKDACKVNVFDSYARLSFGVRL